MQTLKVNPTVLLQQQLMMIQAGKGLGKTPASQLDYALSYAVRQGTPKREIIQALHCDLYAGDSIPTLGRLLATDCSTMRISRLNYLCNRAPMWLACAHKNVLCNGWRSEHHGQLEYEVKDADGELLKLYKQTELHPVLYTVMTAQLETERHAQVFKVWALDALYPEYTRRKGVAHACEARMQAIQWGQQ